MNKKNLFITIYGYKNKLNNKWYIGQTQYKPSARSGIDGKKYLEKNKNGDFIHSKFAPAIEKYGWENFELNILFEAKTFIEANIKEKEFIEIYNSVNEGYNCTYGGQDFHIFSEESCKKRSESRKGSKNPAFGKYIKWKDDDIRYSEEYRNKARENFLKNKECLANRKNTIETNIKRARTNFRKKHPGMSLLLYNSTTNEKFYFLSFMDAGLFFNDSNGNGVSYCFNKNFKYYNFSIDIVNSENNVINTYQERYNGEKKTKKKKVIAENIETGEILHFNSAAEGEFFITQKRKNTGRVIRCCKGIRNSFGGYKWRYDENN